MSLTSRKERREQMRFRNKQIKSFRRRKCVRCAKSVLKSNSSWRHNRNRQRRKKRRGKQPFNKSSSSPLSMKITDMDRIWTRKLVSLLSVQLVVSTTKS